MASSTVKGLNVEITANISGLTAGFKKAESKMKSFGSRVDKFGRSLRNTFSAIFAIGGGGAALVAPLVSFESQMNRVRAITGLTGDEFDKVSKKALNLGKTTELTATQAAKGFVQLFKKGQTAAEALKGIDTVLGLVTVGELNAADAANIASAAFKVFGKTGETFVSLGDKMSKASTSSGIDIKDFALLISKAGNTAVNAGVDFSSLSAAFGVLRDRAVGASEAATALRNIMQRASGRSAKALAKMADLKLDFFDNAGRFVGFAQAMDRFNKATKGLDPKAIGDISKLLFGSRAAGKVLGLAEAADDIVMLEAVINASKGSLAAFRKELLKGISGGLILAISAIERMAISLSESLKPQLISVIKGVKDFANYITELPSIVKKLGLGAIALGAAFLLATVAVGALASAFRVLFLGVILKAIGKFVLAIGVNLVAALTGANVAALGLKATMSLLWKAILAPLLKIAGVLLIIPATFFAVLIAIEKLGSVADKVLGYMFKMFVKFANKGLEAVRQALLKMSSLMLDVKDTALGKFMKSIGVDAQSAANKLLGVSNVIFKLENGLVAASNEMQKNGGEFAKLGERAKTTRLEIAKLIEEATGFKFSNFGSMFSGGGDKPDAGGGGDEKKRMLAEAKIEAMSLLTIMNSLSFLFDDISEKLSGKTNAFSGFMKSIGKDLEEYKKQIGTVQQQVSQIITSSIQMMANGIGEIFAKTIVDGKSFFKSAKDLMKSFARQFIKQVVSMIAQLLILSAAQALFNNLSKTPVVGQAENSAALAGASSFAASAAGFLATMANGLTTIPGSGRSEKRSFGNDFGGESSLKKQKTEQTIILELDGRQLTKTIVEHMPSVIRTGSGTIRST